MKKEQLLIKCLEEILSDKMTFEQCAGKYPYLADELAALLKIAAKIRAEGVGPTDEFKKRAAMALSAEMQTHVPPSRVKASPGWLRNIFSPGALAFKFVLIVIILALSGGGTVFASQDSLPSDTLYPVKRGAENVRLVLTFTPESKADVYLELVRNRVEETIKVTAQESIPEISALNDVPEEISQAIHQIAKTSRDRERLLTQLMETSDNEQKTLSPLLDTLEESHTPPLKQSLSALRRGKLIGEISYYNPAFLASSPSIYDDSLESSAFKIEGHLIAAEDGSWNIGGVKLVNVNTPSETPQAGTRLKTMGVVSTNTTFLGSVESQPPENEKTVIEGLITTRSEDGSVIYIGGLELEDSESLKDVPAGTLVRIEGKPVEGVFHLEEDEEEDYPENHERGDEWSEELNGGEDGHESSSHNEDSDLETNDKDEDIGENSHTGDTTAWTDNETEAGEVALQEDESETSERTGTDDGNDEIKRDGESDHHDDDDHEEDDFEHED